MNKFLNLICSVLIATVVVSSVAVATYNANMIEAVAGAYIYNAPGTTIDILTAGGWQAFGAMTTEHTENMTIEDYKTGLVTAFADGTGKVVVTSASHTLEAGDFITLTGTTNYNGVWEVADITPNTFTIPDTWVSDDATGTWAKGTTFKIQYKGIYQFTGAHSASSAGTNQTYGFALFKNGIFQENCWATHKYANADIGVTASTCLLDMEVGDEVFSALRNNTSTSDFIVYIANLVFSKQ